MSIIKCENLKVTYILKKNQLIDGLNGLSISFSSGKVNVIFGENGCGKTTLFNCITGLLPYDGEIFFDDIDAQKISIKDRHISYVQQNLALFPKLTIFDNLAYPLKNLKLSQEEITKRIYDILEIFEIPYLMNCLPKQISIGQLQKVSLAKAIITNPRLLILDEAFSNLDPSISKIIQKIIKNYAKKEDAVVVYVTHDIKEALSFGDHLYIIDNSKVLFEQDVKGLTEEYLKQLIIKNK